MWGSICHHVEREASRFIPSVLSRRADNGYFGFAVVKVSASGQAFVESHGRDYPPGLYLAPSPAERFPTTIRDAGELTWRPAEKDP